MRHAKVTPLIARQQELDDDDLRRKQIVEMYLKPALAVFKRQFAEANDEIDQWVLAAMRKD